MISLSRRFDVYKQPSKLIFSDIICILCGILPGNKITSRLKIHEKDRRCFLCSLDERKKLFLSKNIVPI